MFLFDRISLVTMLLCLLLSTFYAKSQGSLKYVNGDVYVGELKESKHHGYGTYKWVNGDVYVGEWKEGKQHGQGTYKWVNGDTHIVLESGKVTNAMALARSSTQATVTSILDIGNTANDAASFCR
jgi:hypothetical protein